MSKVSERRLLDPAFIARLDRLDILSRKILAGKLRGEKLTRRTESSVDLADFRDYAPGDDPRFIDWNIYARLDRLLLKLFLAEEDFFLHVLMDTSRSCDYGEPNKWMYIQQVAATLGYVGLVGQGWVSITAMADGLAGATELLRGHTRLPRMLDFIAAKSPKGKSAFAEACAAFRRARQHKGICVILSDFLFREGIGDGLRMLAGGGHEIYCIQVLSPQELDPAIDGELRLVDMENDSSVDVTPTATVVRHYKANLQAHVFEAENAARRLGATHVLADTSVPFDRFVLDCLRRRGLLA
jgi:uncharacterized protein (DUF58 family)